MDSLGAAVTPGQRTVKGKIDDYLPAKQKSAAFQFNEPIRPVGYS